MEHIAKVRQAIDYIEAHLREDITVEGMATAIHYSPSHFHLVFAKVTGGTVAQYIRRRRLGPGCLGPGPLPQTHPGHCPGLRFQFLGVLHQGLQADLQHHSGAGFALPRVCRDHGQARGQQVQERYPEGSRRHEQQGDSRHRRGF